MTLPSIYSTINTTESNQGIREILNEYTNESKNTVHLYAVHEDLLQVDMINPYGTAQFFPTVSKYVVQINTTTASLNKIALFFGSELPKEFQWDYVFYWELDKTNALGLTMLERTPTELSKFGKYYVYFFLKRPCDTAPRLLFRHKLDLFIKSYANSLDILPLLSKEEGSVQLQFSLLFTLEVKNPEQWIPTLIPTSWAKPFNECLKQIRSNTPKKQILSFGSMDPE